MKLRKIAGEYRYAVAVREGSDLWLALWVKRSKKGEFFVLLPRKDGRWDNHTSYHLDGTRNMKSRGRHVFEPSQRQPLTGQFRGTESLWQIAGHDPKSVGKVAAAGLRRRIADKPSTWIPERRFPRVISHNRTSGQRRRSDPRIDNERVPSRDVTGYHHRALLPELLGTNTRFFPAIAACSTVARHTNTIPRLRRDHTPSAVHRHHRPKAHKCLGLSRPSVECTCSIVRDGERYRTTQSTTAHPRCL